MMNDYDEMVGRRIVNIITIVAAAVVAIVICLFLRDYCGYGEGRETMTTDTVLVTKVDTFWQRDTIYKVVAEHVIRYVPVPSDTVYQDDTVYVSKVDSIPITQKAYQGDNYHAWVSGYLPNLDSIDVKTITKTETVTITNTIRKRAPRWSLGVQVGAGIGLVNRQADVFVGLGASYRLFPK